MHAIYIKMSITYLDVLNVVLPNPNLRVLIVSYIGETEIWNPLSRLETLRQAILEGKRNQTLATKLGRRLQSLPHIALCLSEIYCSIFDKTMPVYQKIKRRGRASKPQLCLNGHMSVYPIATPRGRDIYCEECSQEEYDGRSHRWGYRYYKHPDLYVYGSTTPPTYSIHKPTRAFRYLHRHHPGILILAAREIYDAHKQ